MGGRGWIFFSLVFLGTLFLVGLVLWEPGPNEEGSPRADRLAEFGSEMDLGDKQLLIWSPTLTSELYDVGAVFPENGLGMATTLACDKIEPKSEPMNVTLGAGKRYEVTPEAKLAEGASFDLEGAKAVEYRLALKEADVLTAEDELIAALTSDPDCLAAIVNVPVYVLYGVFRGDEAYSISRTIMGNIAGGAFVPRAKSKLGLSASGKKEADFERKDSNLIWALTKVQIVDDRFPTGPGTEAFRQAKAREVLREETDYVARAGEMAEIAAPSAEEADRVIEMIERDAAASGEEPTE